MPITTFMVVLLVAMWLSYVPFPRILRLSKADYPHVRVPLIAPRAGSLRLQADADKAWIEQRQLELRDGAIELPQDLSPGWHDLALELGTEKGTKHHALYVAPYSADDFTFVQLTDMHTPCYGGRDIEERVAAVSLINSMGPAFVLDTGDMTDYGLEEQYAWYERIISVLDVPLYTIPGNMETYSDANLERYEQHLGPANYYFYFGETLFVAGASLHAPRSWGGFDADQIRWLDNTLSRPAGLKFLLNHIPIASKEGRDYRFVPWGWKDGHFSQIEQGYDRIMAILMREKVTTLSGHWHGYSARYEYGGAVFYNTPSITRMSSVKAGPRFRLFRVQGGVVIYDQVIECDRLGLTCQYATDRSRVVIQIYNDHEFSVPLSVRVTLSPSRSPYATDVGEILASTASGDIWVRYDAPVGISQVQVAPAS